MLKYYYNGEFFNEDQFNQILGGVKNALTNEQIGIYANPIFTYEQMKEIRYGLMEGLDVSVYADPKYSWQQMKVIKLGLLDGIDVSKYAEHKYDYKQMGTIRYGLVIGVDVSKFADPKYSAEEMWKIVNDLWEKTNGSGNH